MSAPATRAGSVSAGALRRLLEDPIGHGYTKAAHDAPRSPWQRAVAGLAVVAMVAVPLWAAKDLRSARSGEGANAALREQVQGDLADRDAVIHAATGCEAIFHNAAKAGACSRVSAMALPTGTDAIFPVRLTVSPSAILSTSPMMAMPTLSSSRLSTRPRTPPGNSTSSSAMAFSGPYTREIPSPTERTTPVSLSSIFLS